jgi:hypothetical protein
MGHPSGILAACAEAAPRDGKWIVVKAIMSRIVCCLMEDRGRVPRCRPRPQPLKPHRPKSKAQQGFAADHHVPRRRLFNALATVRLCSPMR